jgi:hypothetical protein
VPPSYTWQALEGQGWPATHSQESVLVEELRRAARAGRSSTKADSVCVFTALRCGVVLEELVRALPGVSLPALLHSYDQLALQLESALTAWGRIVEDPTPDTLAEHGPNAARLLPAPVHRVRVVISQAESSGAVQAAVGRVVERLSSVTAKAHAIEDQLTRLDAGDPLGIRLGAELHSVPVPALWAEEYFVPRRVGELSPSRAADLRGDPR